MRPGLLAVLAAAGLAAASCAGAPGDTGSARETARAWLLAVYESDGERACELLAPERVEEVERTASAAALAASPDLPADRLPTCETVYSAQAETLAEPLAAAGVTAGDLESSDGILAVEVAGERATVTVAGGVRTVELRRTAEGWRVVRSAAG
jgi:hypothetical protein